MREICHGLTTSSSFITTLGDIGANQMMHPKAISLTACCIRTYSCSLWVLLRASSIELVTKGSNMPDSKHVKGIVDRVSIRLTRLSMNLSGFKGKEETSTGWKDG